MTVWQEAGFPEKENIAKQVYNTGQVMLATELRSVKRYWHVHHSDMSKKIYPKEYTPHVVAILWQTMAQLQTWFGGAGYLAYGIQLLPLTSISEQRDSIDWVKAMYPAYALSCQAYTQCSNSGWAIVELAMLATAGHSKLAAETVTSLPSSVFTDPGGNGHSLSNTILYFATRPEVDDPLSLEDLQAATVDKSKSVPAATNAGKVKVTDCTRPEICTDYELDTIASVYTCRQRIQYLMEEKGKSQDDACFQVAGIEFPKKCGACNPYSDQDSHPITLDESQCPHCTSDMCNKLGKYCPSVEAPFLCTLGLSAGGCSERPWSLSQGQCSDCCKITPGCAK